MTISQITIAAAVIAVLGIVALVAMGWRARSPVSAPGATGSARVRQHPTDLERAVPPWQRLRAVGASFGLAVWIGVALATVLSIVASSLVVTVTGMLKR